MRESLAPKLSKWPFLLGAVLLFGMAAFICLQSQTRDALHLWEIVASSVCAITGAGCGILPFVLEYRVAERLMVAERLGNIAAEIRKLDHVAGQITDATARWQTVQESADKTAASAKSIADRMAGEMKEFMEFVKVADESEKATLRLEVDKLRRAEGDWLQVLVRILDHVYALQQAAVRSGQPSLIEQLGQFQNACRDAARRVGLIPYASELGDAFNKERHQVVEGEPEPAPNATVQETIATGYTFQGKLLRPALVRAQSPGEMATTNEPTL